MPPHLNGSSDYQESVNDAEQHRIRAMTITDIPAVFQIDRTTWGDQSWTVEYIFDILHDPLYDCWILESNTAACPILGYGFQASTQGISHITNLCLHPDQRGRGLGGVLLRHMIAYARWLSTPIITLEVNTTNIHAYTLYVKHGFIITQHLPQYYSDSADAYRMELFLNMIDK